MIHDTNKLKASYEAFRHRYDSVAKPFDDRIKAIQDEKSVALKDIRRVPFAAI